MASRRVVLFGELDEGSLGIWGLQPSSMGNPSYVEFGLLS